MKALLCTKPSNWGFVTNGYLNVVSFEDKALKMEFIKNELLGGVDLETALSSHKDKLYTKLDNSRITIKISKNEYPEWDLETLKNKNYLIVENESKYYFYNVQGVVVENTNTLVTFTGIIDPFMTYDISSFFKLDSKCIIKQGHYDRYFKDSTSDSPYPILNYGTPNATPEQLDVSPETLIVDSDHFPIDFKFDWTDVCATTDDFEIDEINNYFNNTPFYVSYGTNPFAKKSSVTDKSSWALIDNASPDGSILFETDYSIEFNILRYMSSTETLPEDYIYILGKDFMTPKIANYNLPYFTLITFESMKYESLSSEWVASNLDNDNWDSKYKDYFISEKSITAFKNCVSQNPQFGELNSTISFLPLLPTKSDDFRIVEWTEKLSGDNGNLTGYALSSILPYYDTQLGLLRPIQYYNLSNWNVAAWYCLMTTYHKEPEVVGINSDQDSLTFAPVFLLKESCVKLSTIHYNLFVTNNMNNNIDDLFQWKDEVKIYTSPYYKYRIQGQNTSYDLPPQFLYKDDKQEIVDVWFDVSITLSPESTHTIIKPNGGYFYNNKPQNQTFYEEVNSTFLPVAIDQYSEYLTQHGSYFNAMQKINKRNAVMSEIEGGLKYIGGLGFSVASGFSGLSPLKIFGAEGVAASTMMSGIKELMSSRDGINLQNAQVADISRSPDKYQGSTNDLSMYVANDMVKPRIYKMKVPEIQQKAIAYHFHKFGVNYNGILTNINDVLFSRYYFNFVQTDEVYPIISLEVSNDVKILIDNAFQGGLRIWHYRDSKHFKGIGNYDVNNLEMWWKTW